MSATNHATTPERFISLKEVERLTSLKKSTLYNMMSNGSFPRGVALTPRRRGWVDSEVQAWIGSRLDGNRPPEARP